MRYPDGGGLTGKQRAQRERVRFEAAEMFAQGVAPPQVARRLRVSRKSSYAWRAGGSEALQGPVRETLADEAGLGGPGWTPSWNAGRPRMAGSRTSPGHWPGWPPSSLSRFHVRFSPAQTWRILRQMGWSVQAPVHRAAERDEEAIAVWRKETWPAVERR